jgi:thymidine phosphorylase
LYAIRDVTATVPSIPLITASILSKKIAAGLQGLVMDVKTGNGAFMQTLDRGRELSRSIIGTAATAGLSARTLITDMNEVLGATAGNAVEIAESVEFLRGERREHRLNEVVLALCAEMLIVGGIETDRDVARQRCDRAVSSGRAAEIFGQMVSALGGPVDFVEKYETYLPHAPIQRAVIAEGIVAAVDTRGVGHAIIELGGGRHMVGEELDLSVGLTRCAPIGTELDSDTPLAVIHAASEDDAAAAEQRLLAAVTLAEEASPERPVICEILTG